MKLNKLELLKISQSPKEYYKNLESLDPKNLSEADIFYLKNFGIYTTKLNPNNFMLRCRIPGGRVTKEHLYIILKLAKQFLAPILLTARSQIELHHLSFDQALYAHRELIKRGFNTFGTLTDNFRNIVTDVLDGIESEIEAFTIIEKIEPSVTDLSTLGSIPRKFNTAIVGTHSSTQSFFGNDAFFGLAKKDGIYGFNLYLGGKNGVFAKPADIFVKTEEIVDLFIAIAKCYQRYGHRRSRTKARLFHLLETIGIEGFKERLLEFYPKKIESAGEYLIQKREVQSTYQTQKGDYLYRIETDYGRPNLELLERLLEFEGSLRLGIDQNIYLVSKKELSLKLSKPRNIVACAGSQWCIYSLLETKEEVNKLPLERISKLQIKIGLSGCLKGCGRHFAADIGMVGIRTNQFKKVERGVRLYLGGLYSKGTLPARLIFWAVPLRKLTEVINTILDLYEESGAKDFEAFSMELAPYQEEQIAYLILQRFLGQHMFLSQLPSIIEKKEIAELEQIAFG